MNRRTALYLLTPVVLLVVWSTVYLVWGDDLRERQRARVEVQTATVVESTPLEILPLHPAVQELIQPMDEARREWMQEMASEQKEMITRAFEMLDELEQELPPKK